jgi:hypothetical protein
MPAPSRPTTVKPVKNTKAQGTLGSNPFKNTKAQERRAFVNQELHWNNTSEDKRSTTKGRCAFVRRRRLVVAAIGFGSKPATNHGNMAMADDDDMTAPNWIEPTMLELLTLTMERLQSLPVLLVTFRAEYQPLRT